MLLLDSISKGGTYSHTAPISKGGLFAGPISADVGSDRIWLVSVKGYCM